jgi:glycolate oxidase FAD binding subunit
VGLNLEAFADAVGAAGPVCCRGGGTRWEVGGAADPAARVVHAPAGVVAHRVEEMTVTCGAGTPVRDLHAELAPRGQVTTLAGPDHATVGGVLAVGWSGVRRVLHGPVRDALLEVRYVDACGQLVRGGGPTVKNVSGFDLCRLLVGSLGTLGLFGQVTLRTRPLPARSEWLSGPVSDDGAEDVRRALYRPASVLATAQRVWVLLEGRPEDVDAQAAALARFGLSAADGPPPLPPHRWSVPPERALSTCRELGPAAVAELGVGVVHADRPAPKRDVDAVTRHLHAQIKRRFDPTGRLTPGRTPLER